MERFGVVGAIDTMVEGAVKAVETCQRHEDTIQIVGGIAVLVVLVVTFALKFIL